MDRVVVVTKPTRLEELIAQYLTEGAAQFSLESQGKSIEPYRVEDATYRAALAEIHRQIPNDLSVTTVSRRDVPHFLFRDNDLIVACGPDGLFIHLAKYVGDQLVLTVNPDPRQVAGALMLFPPSAVGKAIAQVRAGTHQVERLPFAKAVVDDRVVWGIGDIFIGRRDHISARYEISFDGRQEVQSSSGIIVSTGIGCPGWIRSIATMAAGLHFGRLPRALEGLPSATDAQLVFVVREPFPSPDTGVSIVTGRVFPSEPLRVTSTMPTGGCIFSDGVTEKVTD